MGRNTIQSQTSSSVSFSLAGDLYIEIGLIRLWISFFALASLESNGASQYYTH